MEKKNTFKIIVIIIVVVVISILLFKFIDYRNNNEENNSLVDTSPNKTTTYLEEKQLEKKFLDKTREEIEVEEEEIFPDGTIITDNEGKVIGVWKGGKQFFPLREDIENIVRKRWW